VALVRSGGRTSNLVEVSFPPESAELARSTIIGCLNSRSPNDNGGVSVESFDQRKVSCSELKYDAIFRSRPATAPQQQRLRDNIPGKCRTGAKGGTCRGGWGGSQAGVMTTRERYAVTKTDAGERFRLMSGVQERRSYTNSRPRRRRVFRNGGLQRGVKARQLSRK